MGGQHPTQRNTCKDRYEECLESYEDCLDFPPFHHGSHYACMWYMIRLEPYTSLHIWLQEVRFDQSPGLCTSAADCRNLSHGIQEGADGLILHLLKLIRTIALLNVTYRGPKTPIFDIFPFTINIKKA
jgi:hypothetical protein